MEKEDNISPEERLFKAIKGADNQEPTEEKEGLEAVFEEKQSKDVPLPIDKKQSRPNPLLKAVSSFKSSLVKTTSFIKNINWKNPKEDFAPKGLSFNIQEIDIALVNKILIFLLALFLIYFVYYVKAHKKSIKSLIDTAAKINYQIREDEIEFFKTQAFYLSQVNQRNIFKLYEEKAVSSEEKPQKQNNSEKLKAIVKNFKVIGISWGKNAMAMIMDKENNKTYFLKEGQMIASTKVVVKKIMKKKIFIGLDEEEIELK